MHWKRKKWEIDAEFHIQLKLPSKNGGKIKILLDKWNKEKFFSTRSALQEMLKESFKLKKNDKNEEYLKLYLS